MSTGIKCQAQDPSACRYHGTGVANILKERYQEAEQKLNDSRNTVEEDGGYAYFLARLEFENAETDYYATNEGYAKLTSRLQEARDNNDDEAVSELEIRQAATQYKMELNEEAEERDRKAGGSLLLGPHKQGYTPPAEMEGGGNQLWPEVTGAKYDYSMSTRNIKSAVLKDLKEAQQAKWLPPHLRFDVRSSKNNLDVTIIGVTDEQLYEGSPDDSYYRETRPEAFEVKDRVEKLVMQYNHIQDDIIEGRRNISHFWEKVSYEADWQKDAREKREAARKEKKVNA